MALPWQCHGSADKWLGIEDVITADHEPQLFKCLGASGIYPKVHAVNICSMANLVESQVTHGKFGRVIMQSCWIKFRQSRLLQSMYVYTELCGGMVCRGVVRIMSDNSLLFVCMVAGRIVIIDAGRRLQSQIIKSRFNIKCLKLSRETLKVWLT